MSNSILLLLLFRVRNMSFVVSGSYVFQLAHAACLPHLSACTVFMHAAGACSWRKVIGARYAGM
jgi:hypothetical protein